ncbi:MAG: PIN domain-containing protein [Oscillospiraceae bacterium]|nr:PIN domain-containing protein [Oscillospiraceae bacterium]
MTVMIDTNIILDYILERENFAETSRKCIEYLDENNIKSYLTASTVTDIHYFALKYLKDNNAAKNVIKILVDSFQIASVSKTDCLNALKLKVSDYEDSLLAVCAQKTKADYIITRNVKHFLNSPVKAVKPSEFLDFMKSLQK